MSCSGCAEDGKCTRDGCRRCCTCGRDLHAQFETPIEGDPSIAGAVERLVERLTRERDEARSAGIPTKIDPGECAIGDIHWITRVRNNLVECLDQLEAAGRVRNNLVECLDQLEAAGREVARLTKLGNEVACALGVEGEPDATVAHTAWEARGLIMAGVVVRTERDALRHERDALLAENAQLRAELAGARRTDARRMDDALAAYEAAAPTGERDGGP